MATKAPPRDQVDIASSLVSSIYDIIINDWLDRDIKCGEYKDTVRVHYRRLAWGHFRLSHSYDRARYNNILTGVFNKLNARIRTKQNRHKKRLQLDRDGMFETGYETPEARWLREMSPFLTMVHQHECPIDGLPPFDPTYCDE